MSLSRLTMTFAPIATGTVVFALFAFQKMDARTRMLLQIIAWLGTVATVIGLITSGPELLDALIEMQPRLKRLLKDFKTLSIETQRAFIAGSLTILVSLLAYAVRKHPKSRPAIFAGVAAVCIASATYLVTNFIRESSVRDLLAKGDEHLKAYRYSEAIAAYSKAIDLDPNSTNYRARANAFWKQNRIDRAVEDLSKVIAGSEATGEDYRLRAWGLEIEKRFDESLASYTKAIELDDSWTHYHHRANLFSRLGRHEEAVKDYTRSIEVSKGEIGCLLYSRGSSYLSLGRKKEAIDDFKKEMDTSRRLEWCNKLARNELKNLGIDVEQR